jgi:hypothetical protein
MVFNATFNNISVILWRSVLLVGLNHNAKNISPLVCSICSHCETTPALQVHTIINITHSEQEAKIPYC